MCSQKKMKHRSSGSVYTMYQVLQPTTLDSFPINHGEHAIRLNKLHIPPGLWSMRDELKLSAFVLIWFLLRQNQHQFIIAMATPVQSAEAKIKTQG